MLCLLSLPLTLAATEEGGGEGDTDFGIEVEEEVEPYHALLFPSFCLTIGIFVYFLLSRYLQALPYTAVMFLIGTCM